MLTERRFVVKGNTKSKSIKTENGEPDEEERRETTKEDEMGGELTTIRNPETNQEKIKTRHMRGELTKVY